MSTETPILASAPADVERPEADSRADVGNQLGANGQPEAGRRPVAGDRTTTPVSGPIADAKRALRHRGVAVVALIAFGALLIWGWGSPKAKIEGQTARPIVTQRAPFEPAREPTPSPEIPAQKVAVVPVQRPFADPQPPAQPDTMLDAARRAPVLIYNRPPQRAGAPAVGMYPGEEGAAGYPHGAGYGAPEPRNELADRLKPTVLEGSRAGRLPNRDLVVAQGTAIPCTLETAMSSDVAGFVSCVVPRDVMSDNGRVVLMEKGTQVVGEYRGTMRRGSSRMFVLWSRAKTPTGVIVQLASPATDALGRAGFDGQVDNHFWERFGGALLLSIVGDAGQIAGQQLSEGGIQINTARSGGQSAAAIATENTINIPPTLMKNQGEAVAIFVARDLDFSSVYSLRAVGGRTEMLDRAAGLAPARPLDPGRPVYKP